MSVPVNVFRNTFHLPSFYLVNAWKGFRCLTRLGNSDLFLLILRWQFKNRDLLVFSVHQTMRLGVWRCATGKNMGEGADVWYKSVKCGLLSFPPFALCLIVRWYGLYKDITLKSKVSVICLHTVKPSVYCTVSIFLWNLNRWRFAWLTGRVHETRYRVHGCSVKV